jgi:hypothetical protein
MSLRDTWHAWLGPAADTIADDQLDRLDAAASAINERWPGPDDGDTREAALSAAAQVVLGDTALESFAADWHRARAHEDAAHVALTGALVASSTGARTGPGSESDLVQRSGASRLTVRKAIGR